MTTQNPQLEAGLALHRQRKVQEAAVIYRQILNKDPVNADALHYLGLAQMQLGNLSEASALLSRSLKVNPRSANALCDLGTVMVRSEKPGKGLELFAQALEIDSQHSDALNNMGATLSTLKRPFEALPYFERLIAVRPRSSAAWSQLAENQLMLNLPEKAITNFRKAIVLNPELEHERVLLGEALESLGRFTQARFQYVSVLEGNPSNAMALGKLLSLRDMPPDKKWVANAHRLLETASLETQAKVRLHVALGHYYDAAGDYDRAFEHVTNGHKLRPTPVLFESRGFTEAVNRLMEFFSPEFFATLPAHEITSRRPIFIVGMPRSGTTLTEQVLSSHSKVAAGGELPTIMNIGAEIEAASRSGKRFPECIRDLGPSDLERHATTYLKRLDRVSAHAERVTDKLPFNFMHVGLIAALFPQAKIVHCRRQPLDTCVSCYFVNFADEMPFATDLKTLGNYYVDYYRLMKHWERVLPIRMFDLEYERFVHDTDRVVCDLLSYCELEWQDACLRFYETERGVRTPSRWQVRQPIYSKSIDRWRRYERHLQPLMDILAQG